MNRTFAFLVRSLRQESRYVSHHAIRGALAAVVMFMFYTTVAQSLTRVGAGGIFAGEVFYACYGFLTLAGAIYFSVSIVEEKEEQTLPLLRMTGATPLTILAGKSVPRLAIAGLFILIIAPFLLLSITLGGVLLFGLLSSLLGLLSYAVMLCQLGLLASVLARSASRAFTLTILFWIAVEWGGLLLTFFIFLFNINTWGFGGGAVTPLDGVAEWLTMRSLGYNLSGYLTSWDSTEVWQPQMTFHLMVAFGSFALSWLLFERATAGAIAGTDQATEGEASRPMAVLSGKRAAQRVTGDAIAWKSWQHVSGGGLWFALRIILLPILCIGLTLLFAGVFGESIEIDAFAYVMIWIGFIVGLMNCARLMGTVLNREVREKTVNGLLMLPHSTTGLVRRLIGGVLPGVASGFACFVLGLGLLWLADRYNTRREIIEILGEPYLWHFGSWILMTVMLGLVLSVRMRYGGMLIAAAICGIGGPMIVGTCLSFLIFQGGGPGTEDVILVMLIMVELIICGALWFRLIQDVERVGARE